MQILIVANLIVPINCSALLESRATLQKVGSYRKVFLQPHLLTAPIFHPLAECRFNYNAGFAMKECLFVEFAHYHITFFYRNYIWERLYLPKLTYVSEYTKHEHLKKGL